MKRRSKKQKEKKRYLLKSMAWFIVLGILFIAALGFLIFRDKPLFISLKEKGIFYTVDFLRQFTSKKIYIEGESEFKYKALQEKKTEIVESSEKLNSENQKREILQGQLGKKIDSLNTLREEISQLITRKEEVLGQITETISREEEAKMQHELAYYKSLKFNEAAKIMLNLDDDELLIYLLKNFEEKNVQKFLASVPPERAAELIKLLAASKAKDTITGE